MPFYLLAVFPDYCRDFDFIAIFYSVSLAILLFALISVAGFCLLKAIGGISTDSWLALSPFIACMPLPLAAGICLGRVSIDWDRWRPWWVNCWGADCREEGCWEAGLPPCLWFGWPRVYICCMELELACMFYWEGKVLWRLLEWEASMVFL